MAGLVPQSFIDDLLARTNIVDIIDKRVQLKRTGINLKACCPFHKEKTPSFTVNEAKQFYYCFGCGAAGNAIGFLMEYENLTFPEAVDSLAGILGLEVPRENSNENRPNPAVVHAPLYKALEKSQEFFASSLRKHPQAKTAVSYLKQRGLSGEIARDFGIGFAPVGWRNLLQHCGNHETKQLVESGMVIENNDKTYDRFRNRITFPIKNTRGKIVGFGGRIIDPKDSPKYLNSPETPVFNKSRELYGLFEAKKFNRRLEQLVVVEGYMDVIALAQSDIRYAVAALGTAFGSTHVQLLSKYTKRICFCFDGDNAGRKAAQKALEVSLPLIKNDSDIRFLFLPEGHDPDSYVREHGKAIFEKQLQNAQELSEFLFASAANNQPLNSVDQRAKFTSRAKALINLLPEGDYKQLMLAELASRTGLSLEIIADTEAQALPKPEPAAIETDPSFSELNEPPAWLQGEDYLAATEISTPMSYETDDSLSIAQRRPLSNSPIVKLCLLVLHQPQLIQHIDINTLDESWQSHPELKHLMEDIQLRHERNKQLNTGALLGYWMRSKQDSDVASELLGFEKLWPAEGAKEELDQIQQHLLNKLNTQKTQQELEALKAIPISQMSDDQKQKLRQLLRKLH